MATMLAVLTTDAPLERDALDGDGSRRDRRDLQPDQRRRGPLHQRHGRAAGRGDRADRLGRARARVHAVCAELAHRVVADGEGASRVAAVRVTWGRDPDDAELLARSVATSLLVRAAIHGADPNWGRILMALGNAGVELRLDRGRVDCAGTTVCRSVWRWRSTGPPSRPRWPPRGRDPDRCRGRGARRDRADLRPDPRVRPLQRRIHDLGAPMIEPSPAAPASPPRPEAASSVSRSPSPRPRCSARRCRGSPGSTVRRS
jgi:hypothetical protein